METAPSGSERPFERDEPVSLPAVVSTPHPERALVPASAARLPTRWRRLAAQVLPIAGAALTYAAQRLTPVVIDAVLDAVERRLDRQGRFVSPATAMTRPLDDGALTEAPRLLPTGRSRGRRRRWRGGDPRG